MDELVHMKQRVITLSVRHAFESLVLSAQRPMDMSRYELLLSCTVIAEISTQTLVEEGEQKKRASVSLQTFLAMIFLHIRTHSLHCVSSGFHQERNIGVQHSSRDRGIN